MPLKEEHNEAYCDAIFKLLEKKKELKSIDLKINNFNEQEIVVRNALYKAFEQLIPRKDSVYIPEEILENKQKWVQNKIVAREIDLAKIKIEREVLERQKYALEDSMKQLNNFMSSVGFCSFVLSPHFNLTEIVIRDPPSYNFPKQPNQNVQIESVESTEKSWIEKFIHN